MGEAAWDRVFEGAVYTDHGWIKEVYGIVTTIIV